MAKTTNGKTLIFTTLKSNGVENPDWWQQPGAVAGPTHRPTRGQQPFIGPEPKTGFKPKDYHLFIYNHCVLEKNEQQNHVTEFVSMNSS